MTKRHFWGVAAGLLLACTKSPEPEARSISELNSQPMAGVSEGAAANELLMSGVVEVGADVTIPENATLFLMGRMAGQQKGPPVLVKRIFPVSLPLSFSLTGQDQMMQGTPVPDKMRLAARLDQDGDAISRTPGDLTGEIGEVERGAKNLKLVLSNVISEPKPSAPVQ